MSESDTVVLGRYFYSWQAEIVHSVLETAGLPSIVSPKSDGLGGAVTDTSTGFRILVKTCDLDRAQQALEAARQAGKEMPSDDEDSDEA